jgi:hypothetical protein
MQVLDMDSTLGTPTKMVKVFWWTDAGSYSLTVTSLEGCSATSDDVIVTVNPLPVVDLGDDITICTGGFVTLDAGNAGSSYVWSTLEVTQQIIVGTAGSYEVTSY